VKDVSDTVVVASSSYCSGATGEAKIRAEVAMPSVKTLETLILKDLFLSRTGCVYGEVEAEVEVDL
jgi:hypothetical protein